MGEGLEVGIAHGVQQLGERLCARDRRTQHQGADEHPDHRVECLLTAAGDRRADGDVRLGADPVQQGRQRGMQHHEHGDAVLCGDGLQQAVGIGVEHTVRGTTAVARHRRTRAVGRQGQQFRNTVERTPPVVELAADR